MKKNGKKIILIVMSFMMCIALTQPVQAASKAKEQKKVKKIVVSCLENAKKGDIVKARKDFTTTFSAEDKKVLKSIPNVTAYYKKQNAKIQYKIRSVKVSGKKATVKLNATYVNAKAYTDVLMEELTKYYMDLILKSMESNGNTNMTEEEIIRDIDNIFKTCNEKVPELPIQKKTIKVKLYKNNKGKWKIDDNSKINNVITADLSSALEKTVSEIDPKKFDFSM